MVKRFIVRGFYSLKILDRLGLLLPFKSSSFRSFLLWCPSSSRFHGPPYAPLRYTSLREASRVSDRLRRGTMRGVECGG